MNLLLVLLFLLQPVGTPVAGSTLYVSEEGLQFPDLPEEIQPVAINSDWELLYYKVSASSRDYVIRGEVRNTSENPLDTPTFVVDLADGSQIGIHPDIDRVGPGERAPFAYSPYDDEVTSALNQSQELAFSGTCNDSRVVPKLTLTWNFQDIEMEYDQDGGRIRVTGNVGNEGQSSVEYYQPTLLVFDKDGAYIGNMSMFENAGPLAVGETLEFEIEHGFNVFHTGDPLSAAGKEPQFVLAMAPLTIGYGDCT